MSRYSDTIYHIASYQEYYALQKILDNYGYRTRWDSMIVNHIVVLPTEKTCAWFKGKYVYTGRACIIMSNFTSIVKMIERCTSV